MLIETLDASFTQDASKKKCFKTFGETLFDMDPSDISTETRIDLIAIDVLSRVFCLEDLLANYGNFGRVEVEKEG